MTPPNLLREVEIMLRASIIVDRSSGGGGGVVNGLVIRALLFQSLATSVSICCMDGPRHVLPDVNRDGNKTEFKPNRTSEHEEPEPNSDHLYGFLSV